jgi:hypothetical protein
LHLVTPSCGHLGARTGRAGDGPPRAAVDAAALLGFAGEKLTGRRFVHGWPRFSHGLPLRRFGSGALKRNRVAERE